MVQKDMAKYPARDDKQSQAHGKDLTGVRRAGNVTRVGPKTLWFNGQPNPLFRPKDLFTGFSKIHVAVL